MAFWTVLLIYYRKQLGALLPRLRKGRGFGVEVELASSLNELSAKSEQAADQPPIPAEPGAAARITEGDQVAETIFREAAQSPRAALMLLSAEMDRQLNLLGAQSGWMLSGPPSRLWSFLLQQGIVPRTLVGGIDQFRYVRNKIVHGEGASDEDVLRALDSGVQLLRAVLQVPREKNRVWKINVPLFSDSQGKTPLRDVAGLILESTSPGGVERRHRVFPTTRTDYEKGKLVSWEWNLARVFPEAWYRESEEDVLVQAWGSSAEFIGRHLD